MRPITATWIFVSCFAFSVGSLPLPLQAAEYPPRNHAGADLILNDGDILWGNHTRVRNFIVLNGTSTVRPFDPATSTGGNLRVEAKVVLLYGTLNATAAGHHGGAGGAGGDWLGETTLPGVYFGKPGVAGKGPAGGIPDPTESETRPGGYGAPGANADQTFDNSVTVGSGGAGGKGGDTVHFNFNDGGDGGAGGSGGGSIKLVANKAFIASSSSQILASGAAGMEASADSNPGQPGAAGAGGGILLELKKKCFSYFEPGFRIETKGGDPEALNGGTVKFAYARQDEPPHTGEAILEAGRIALIPPTGAELAGQWRSQQWKKQSGQYRASLQVENAGLAHSGNFGIAYFLSDDPQLDANDQPLNTTTMKSIPGGRTRRTKVKLTIPDSATPRYVIAHIDWLDQVTETLETNNVLLSDPLN